MAPSPRIGLFVTLLLLVSSVALGQEPEAGPPPQPWNVVLITADTLRGDMLGVNGNTEVTTPNLDTLAADAINFRRAYTCITTTLPAHASLFSSLYARDHKVYGNVGGISSRVTTLFEVLAAAGWYTAAHVNMPWLALDPSNVPQGAQTIRGGDRIRKADATNRWVFNWLDGQQGADKPFFLWIHYVDNHTPYNAPGEYETLYFPAGRGGVGQHPLKEVWHYFPKDHRESEFFQSWMRGVVSADYVVGTYKGSVSWIDEQVGALIHHLEEQGLWEHTLFVFTADHGESLGERNLWFVHTGLYENTAHIPLIVRLPGGPRGAQVDAVVSIVDIMPTVLGRLGVEPPPDLRGVDLWPVVRGEASGVGAALLEHTGKQLEGVVTERYKYIHHLRTIRYYSGFPMDAGKVELYDLAVDPAETDDLSERQPKVVEQMEELLAGLKEGERDYVKVEPAEVGEEFMEALKALGYVE